MNKKINYELSGVSTEASERAVDLMRSVIQKTSRPEVIGDFGGFAGLFDISKVKKLDKPLLATSTDGVGTKIEIARRMDIHDTIGLDLVAMVVDDLVVCGAEPIFMTDYIAVGKVNPERVASIVTGIANGCEIAGCALLGGETAEHPGLMANDEYDIAGAGTGVVDADELLGPNRVLPGDVAIAIESSGLHSNGYSLARHIAFQVLGLDVHNYIEDFGRTIGEEFLEPTKIYAKQILDLLQQNEVHAISHITGGGIAANVARVLPSNLALEIDRSTWSPKPIFDWLISNGSLDLIDAEKAFNMGIGMLLLVPAGTAQDSIKTLNKMGLSSWECGVVRDRKPADEGDSPAKGGNGGVVKLVNYYKG